MYASYDARWRAPGDRFPQATLRQPLRSLYIGKRAARARSLGCHCLCFRSRFASLFRDDFRLCRRSASRLCRHSASRLCRRSALSALVSGLCSALLWTLLFWFCSASRLGVASSAFASASAFVSILHSLVVRDSYNNKHMWRQQLAPYCVAGTSAWCLCKPRHCATPSGALKSPGVWMFAP